MKLQDSEVRRRVYVKQGTYRLRQLPMVQKRQSHAKGIVRLRQFTYIQQR
jgi:hypothetical protein